ncbi:MAG: CapA family protein [Actinomycetia bacterium]|nr:CapA family protein [Actinomycetes bacterium]
MRSIRLLGAAATALVLAACGASSATLGAGEGSQIDPTRHPGAAAGTPAGAETGGAETTDPSPEPNGSAAAASDAGVSGPIAEPSTEPGAEPTETEPALEPLTVTIAASGDILVHAAVNSSAHRHAGAVPGEWDFAPMFAHVEPLLSAADVAICHLETPVSADNTRLTQPNTLVFNSPRQLAAGLGAVGFDGCDFASNHTWDMGLSGLQQTHAVFDDAGLHLAGPAPDEESAGEPVLYTVDEASVAHLAYSYTIFNDWGPNTKVPDNAPWLESSLWPAVGAAGIAADAEAARAAGADFVVVSMHWGEEYAVAPTSDQREIARELLEDGAVDLILGTHVHVIQPCETINGRHVLYGMGNFVSNQRAMPGYRLPVGTQDGLVAEVELTRDADGSISSQLTYQPTHVDLEGHIVRLATPTEYPESHARTVAAVESLGEGACEATVRQ